MYVHKQECHTNFSKLNAEDFLFDNHCVCYQKLSCLIFQIAYARSKKGLFKFKNI